MALLKSRPRIGLRIPNEIRPGLDFQAVVVLDCRRAVEVDHVDVVIEATESWSYGSGENASSRRTTLLRLGARLSEARTLPAGKTELPVRIPLSTEAPPSYRGTHVRIEYEARVHVAIDWWPDAHAAFELKVVPPVVESPPTEPGVYSSDPEGPRGGEPHVELSLASTWTRAGEIVSGAFALSNVGSNRYTDVRVGLRGVETLHHRTSAPLARDHVRYEIRLSAARAEEGEMIPFAFRLPADAMPEYASWPRPAGKSGISSLAWVFEIAVGVGWSGDMTLRIPFRVLPASSNAADAPIRLAPPTVGSDRLRGVWEEAGAAHGLRYEAQSLRGQFGETELVVRRDHMGQGGVHLVAALSHPDLGLDLIVEPASSVRKLVGGGVRTGDAAWDREHYAVARDDEQAAIFLRALLPALRGAHLRRLDDRGLTVQLRDSGQSRARLERFVEGAAHLARAIEALRGRMPPPTKLREVAEEWRALERTLGAPLETARMRVAGRMGMHPAEVRLDFDAAGEPLRTWLAVRLSVPLDASRQLRWSAEDGPAGDVIAPRFKGEVAERLAALAAEARELSLAHDHIALCLPAPLGLARADGQLVPVALAERRLERMAQLATLLRGEAGPYR